MSGCLSERDVIWTEKNLYTASLHHGPCLRAMESPFILLVWSILFGLEASVHGRHLLLESSGSPLRVETLKLRENVRLYGGSPTGIQIHVGLGYGDSMPLSQILL